MEKAEKKLAKKSMENVNSSQIICMVKALAIAYAITCIVFITYAILLTYTSMTEQNVPLISLICTVVSAAVAGFDMAKSAKNKGLIWGLLAGIFYVIILFVIIILSGGNFEFSGGKITTFLISLAGGGIGGVMGVNMKKK